MTFRTHVGEQVRAARVSFARVVRKAESTPSAALIVVQIGSARVEIAAGVDRTTLSELLHALAGSPWGAQS